MNIIRVLLATLSIEPASRFENDANAAYSLGLAYIHSVLEKERHEVKLLFLNNYDYEYSERMLFKYLEEYQPQIVGFQIFSMNRISTYRAIEKMEKLYTQTRIIIGGIHTSVMYEQIIKKYPQVIAVIGEGEITVNELVKAFESNADLESVDGIAFNKNGRVVRTNPRELISNLDSIPFPKHEVFFDNDSNRTVAHIITSRGCPFDCSFCCLKVISKRKYRKRDIANVVQEIKHLKQKYPHIKHIQIHDDTFLLDNQRVIKFCKMLIDLNLKLTFECSARVKPISYDMFYWMEKAGFKKIMFGLETGSIKLLQSIHKNITQNDVIELFETLKPFNFIITTFLICGFPGEDDNTIQETIELVQKTQKIKYNWIAGIGKLWVYPGTEVYDEMKKSSHIDDSFWLSEKSVPYYTVDHSIEKLIEFENEIMDSVSIYRIFTLRGFKNHFLVMPSTIVRYIVKNKKMLPAIISVSLELNFPSLHPHFRKIYKKIMRCD